MLHRAASEEHDGVDTRQGVLVATGEVRNFPPEFRADKGCLNYCWDEINSSLQWEGVHSLTEIFMMKNISEKSDVGSI